MIGQFFPELGAKIGEANWSETNDAATAIIVKVKETIEKFGDAESFMDYIGEIKRNAEMTEFNNKE